MKILKKRAGIVLLITLFFIVLITLLIGENFKTTQKQFENSTKLNFLTQSNLLLLDLERAFQKSVANIGNRDDLNVLLNMPFDFSDKSSDIDFSLKFKSAQNGLHFGRLNDNNDTIAEMYQEVLGYILRDANVYDPMFFIALLQDTYDKDTEERIFGSELSLRDNRFRNGSLDSKKQFDTILDFYAKEREDTNIYNISWDEIVSFRDREVDINYISPLLLRALLPTMPSYQATSLTTQKEELISSIDELDIYESQKERLKIFNVVSYGPSLECSVEFRLRDDILLADFIYNIGDKKIRDVKVRFFKTES